MEHYWYPLISATCQRTLWWFIWTPLSWSYHQALILQSDLHNSTQLNEHLWTQVIKHLNVHIYLVTISCRYYNQLISRTDLFKMFNWSQDWQMLFNTDKRNVGHFAYKTFRLLDTSPTPWTVRPLNVNTREWGRGAGSPSNTNSPGLRPTSILHAKFHRDPSNRLATIHQRYRQDRQTTDR